MKRFSGPLLLSGFGYAYVFQHGGHRFVLHLQKLAVMLSHTAKGLRLVQADHFSLP